MDDSEIIENKTNVILTTDIKPEDCLVEKPKRKRGTLPLEEIAEDYTAKKLSLSKIAEKNNVTSTTISRVLEKMNVKKRSYSESVPNKKILPEYTIVARLENGEGRYKLAKEYHVNPKTIMRLKERNEKEYKRECEKMRYFQIGQLVVSGY